MWPSTSRSRPLGIPALGADVGVQLGEEAVLVEAERDFAAQPSGQMIASDSRTAFSPSAAGASSGSRSLSFPSPATCGGKRPVGNAEAVCWLVLPAYDSGRRAVRTSLNASVVEGWVQMPSRI